MTSEVSNVSEYMHFVTISKYNKSDFPYTIIHKNGHVIGTTIVAPDYEYI